MDDSVTAPSKKGIHHSPSGGEICIQAQKNERSHENEKLEPIHQTINLLFKAAVIIQCDLGQWQ